jgi:hypothetical protein
VGKYSDVDICAFGGAECCNRNVTTMFDRSVLECSVALNVVIATSRRCLTEVYWRGTCALFNKLLVE